MNTEPGTITDKQRKTLFALMQDGEVSLEELENGLTIGLSELSTMEASELIDCFMNHGDLAVTVSKIKGRHKEGKGTLDNVKDDKPAASAETVKHPEHANQPSPMQENAPSETQSFGAIQIGDMVITERDIDQLSKIPKMLNKIYQNIMQEGTDYGVIPGAGDKPTLLKPGAEMLRMAFNLRYKTEIEPVVEDWKTGMFYYRAKTHFSNSKDQYLGTGVGSANSEETRYSNRWVFESDIPEGIDRATLKSQERTSRKGSKYRMYLIEANIHEKATLVNTLQKMAKKRSFVDGVISITGASRIFTQDIEDMAGNR